MGLLDALFDPSTYNGGGLLGALPSYPWQNPPDAAASAAPASFADRFNAIPNAPQPFVPSGRTFDQAQFSPAMYAGSGSNPFDTGTVPLNSPGLPPQFMQPPPQAAPAMARGADDDEDAPAPPPQAGPISVGGYQMPRIGDAAAFTPQAPAQPPAAPAPAVAQPQPAERGMGDRLGAGFRGAMANASSPLGLLFGGIAGLAGMGKGTPEQQQAKQMGFAANALLQKGVDPVTVQAAVANPEIMKTLVEQHFGAPDAKRQDQKAQYQAFVASGLTPQEAMLAVQSPDAAKTLIAQKFGPDKFQHVTVKNADGSESLQAFDPSTGKYSGAPPAAPNKFSVDPNLTGKDRLEALRAVDPLYARKIEAMVAGDIPLPTGVAALRPDAKRTIEDALAVDGAVSASDFKTKADTRKDYASGIASRVTKSINTTIGHFATLDQGVDKLGNYSYFPKISNTVHDLYSSNLDPNYQKAKATFEANKEAAVKELDFALSGGHSSVSGSAELRDKFNRADSPEALHAAITEAMSLLQKRLESHTKAFTEGTKSQRDPQDFIYPENRQAFSKMLGQEGTGVPAAPAGAPAPGAYVWSPDKGLAAK